MLVSCECGAKYKFDDKKLKGAAEKRLDCPKCGRVIVITNPDLFSTKIHEEVLDSGLQRLEQPGFTLSILKGVTGGTVMSLDRPRYTIGRMGTDIQIDDQEASRLHAELEVFPDKVILRDLNSSNGTYVKGQRVSEVTLVDDSEFQIGQTLFTLNKVLVKFD